VRQLVRLIIAERSVIVVIVINTLALFAMAFTDPKLAQPNESPGPVALMLYQVSFWVDFVCVVYFLVEIVLKISTGGWRRFWTNNWNRFDFTVVVLSAPVLLSPLLDVGDLSVLLALRLGRLFRLFRVMRFIPNREHLFLGIRRALKASLGVFLALLLINLVLSLGATQLFGRTAPQFFGDPILASYSLFRVFTIEGWYEIPEAIAKNAHPVIAALGKLYFVGAVLVGGILGLSLANAVFVDEMTMDNNKGIEDKIDQLLTELQELREQIGRSGRAD